MKKTLCLVAIIAAVTVGLVVYSKRNRSEPVTQVQPAPEATSTEVVRAKVRLAPTVGEGIATNGQFAQFQGRTN